MSATSRDSLAHQHLRLLGVPDTLDVGYEKRDVIRLLEGKPCDPAVSDVIHLKLSWLVGSQLVTHIRSKFSDHGWSDGSVLVRTLDDGEASASFQSFDDESNLVLVSRVLQENLIRMANMVVYLDISSGVSKPSPRRSKRDGEAFETVACLTALLRYSILGQRVNGAAPAAPATLDRRSADIAGKMAAGALMFVVAHEFAHIAYGHKTSLLTPIRKAHPATISEVQELQADEWALGFLREFMADDPDSGNIALWCAFIALFATQVTEHALHVRRNRTHPEAWARWAMLEQQSGQASDRTERLRIGFMSALMGASQLDQRFPRELWPVLWRDSRISVGPEITLPIVTEWDRLNSTPLRDLFDEVFGMATGTGRAVLSGLQRGSVDEVLERLTLSPRARNRITDPAFSLDFSTLRRVFKAEAQELTTGNQDSFAMICARLAAVHLGEAKGNDRRQQPSDN